MDSLSQASSYRDSDEAELLQLRQEVERLRVENAELSGRIKLRVSASDRSTILNHIDVMFGISDLQGRFIYFNEAARKLFGEPESVRPPEYLSPLYTLMLPNHTPAPPSEMPVPRALRGEFVTDEEILVKRFDEERERRVLFMSRPLFDPQGALCGVAVYCRDVTKLADTKRAIRRTDARISGVLDAGAVLMAVMELDRRDLIFRLPNRALAEAFKLTMKQLTGRRLSEMEFSPEAVRDCVAAASRCRRGNPARVVEYPLERHGVRRWFQISISRILSIHSLYPLFSVMAKDITTERETVEQMRAGEEQLRLAIEAARMGIWEWDLRTDAFYYSPELEALRGMAPGMSPTTPEGFLELVHPDDRVRIWDSLCRALSKETEFSDQYRTRLPDGAYRWSSNRARVYRDAENNPQRMLGIVMDISDLKEMQAHLLQLQESEGVGLLAGGIAHDFNNLLTAVTGYTELSLETAGLPPDIIPLLENVGSVAMRAAELTKQLLAFAHKTIIEPQVIDINTRLIDVERLLRRLIGEDIELLTRPEAADSRVWMDPGQFEQVLMNLAITARDQMASGGKLELATMNVNDLPSDVAIPTARNLKYVMLAVTDNGRGLDDEARRHAFDPIPADQNEGAGTGLRLATVQGIVEQAGGAIILESQPGGGSCFSVYLPLCAAAEEFVP